MPLYISEKDLTTINELKKRQDHNAIMLGVNRAEFLKREKELMNDIHATTEHQKKYGEFALQNAGVNYHHNEYTIDNTTGEIKILVDGRWEPLGD